MGEGRGLGLLRYRISVLAARAYAYVFLRGLKVWTTYRTQIVLNVFSWVLPVFTYYFTGTALGARIVRGMGLAPQAYTPFIVIGLAFQGYVSSVVTTISQRLRNEQLMGTIEYYLMTQSGVLGMLVYSSLWGFLMNSMSMAVTLTIGYALGVRYAASGTTSAVLVTLELLIATLGLSMLAGGIVMITKQGNPIAFFFSVITQLIAGTVFPVTVLPYWVRLVSYSVPLTIALEALRLSVLEGYGVVRLAAYELGLLVYDVVLLPVGVIVYRLGFDRARKEGTLSEY
ncbi:MAG: ABC transporter permease [Acidilobus sp.]